MAKKTGSALVKNSAFAKKSETESDSKKFGDAVALSEVVAFADKFCGKSEFRDFDGAFNGLQFQNSGTVLRVASAVDAGLWEIRQAAALGANLLVVHHGLYWDAPIPVVGANYEKIRALLDADMAVYSMHLPLDAHPKIGNNKLLADALDLEISGGCVEVEGKDIGVTATVPKGGRAELERRLKNLFADTYKGFSFGSENPKKIAICSGSCGDVVAHLPELGFDTLVCGELRERHFTMARDMGLNLYPCGHYATERFGAMALAETIAEKFGLKTNFIETGNPL